ncbi:opacity protein-like surface antigen [Rhodobium orientis]|uniref:Outer membrane protein beta-barrel domain-containing protein n=1 Tax=Rhodobium orientis TaxID=34017 RepID=A0A327JI38_9HYPH|nr:hypothetical protein [Rhodobium orientis]MBB4302062.1 opacity protein-like surface antigen [Rhodobium orientis]MBK5951346.1 hypothetical protein [Rhodobium orientis]RAI25959.1 hypothetical protein CH339_16100 [Rhodobium orientis]
MTTTRGRLTGRFLSCALAASLCAASPAFAADFATEGAAPPPAEETLPGWQFTIAPYFWGAGVTGDIAQFGLPTTRIDQSFSEILDSLEFAGMIVGEARYGPYSVSTDLSYVQTSESERTPLGLLARRVRVTSKSLRWATLAGYTVYEDARIRLDAKAGVQLSQVETRIRVSGGLLGTRTRTDDATWVDGLAGLRARIALSERFYLTAWGYAGAGGSDFAWDALAGAGYNFTPNTSAFLGYRGNGVDYRDGGFVYDVVQHGPVAGLVFRF